MRDDQATEVAPNALPLPFDYEQLTDSNRESVLADTRNIRGLLTSASHNTVRIGLRLLAVRKRLGAKRFATWRKAEFDWSQATASRYMCAARVFGAREDLSHFMPDALYFLARREVSPAARAEAMARARGGELITKAIARAIVAKYADLASSPESTTIATVRRRLRKVPTGVSREEWEAAANEIIRFGRRMKKRSYSRSGVPPLA